MPYGAVQHAAVAVEPADEYAGEPVGAFRPDHDVPVPDGDAVARQSCGVSGGLAQLPGGGRPGAGGAGEAERCVRLDDGRDAGAVPGQAGGHR
ncbi:hypothetical protein Pflav_031360 [Phytohabitans flavus]|uniref:Uncharacterized protein n=1 Tax=Phytohabitans flavus TaxID=1076124 RepID=A0A6F8XSD1_9ACTN|nr:hypothetical protein Pflav_031360 [Phytohabitans flavus]